ncbi:MAG TPA: DnaJ domain-containing protein [Bryobacteraceae bacterium]|jgi:curved DNA-binding protein CbpA|nr:DnaJ domain-containing protein [Bryobacteraceae bacterium]
MIGSYDDGEITFYEELGVTPEASPEQIRDAFRLFVRLLHPDQQTDPLLKEIAEKQMRKLNRIHAVLSDPARRRRYDEMMVNPPEPALVLNPPSPGARRLMAGMVWGAAIVISAGLLYWLASENTPGGQNRAPDTNSTSSSTSPSAAPPKFTSPAAAGDSEPAQVSQLRADLRAATLERDAAILELNKLRRNAETRPRAIGQSGSALPVERADPKPALTMTELPSAPKLPAPINSALSRIDHPVNRQPVGFWFYAKPKEGQVNKNESLYPPEYIEATITQDGGAIRGRYRSRFRIADRAISPEVNFTFSGTANGQQYNCLWTGAGGAAGELTLRLTSDNSMRIDWTASQLGSQQGLSSGTAVLTRRIE